MNIGDPLAQFKIQKLVSMNIFGMDIMITNSTLFMILTLITSVAFFAWTTRKIALIPSRSQASGEIMVNFIRNLLKDNIGSESSDKFFPIVFSLFMFVLFCNILGMLPYSFTVTSHIIVTFALALFVFLLVTIYGFYKHGLHFMSILVPNGTPTAMVPLLFAIELITYFARPISLSIRLAANMMAGHVMLKVIASFVIALGLFGFVPFILLMLLIGFEIFVAVLQAYIFTVLTCVYLNDAVNLH